MSNKHKKRQIVAIGGGGFSKFGEYCPSNNLIEQYFLRQTGKENPSVCFIPTASGEASKYIIDFYQFFGNLNCKTSHLSLFQPPTADLESFILEKDAIYVGGGNTKSMIALWKEWGLDAYLKKAWESGVVLGGISAGANCWFEECVTDSIPGKLSSLECLGFLKGSCCPHYDTEKARRPSYQQMIQNKQISRGVGIEDHVALHYIDTGLEKAVRSNKSGRAYKVFCEKNLIQEEPIDVVAIEDL